MTDVHPGATHAPASALSQALVLGSTPYSPMNEDW